MKLLSRAWLPAILLIGAALRLIAVPLVHNEGLISDEREYIFLASALQRGEPFIDSNGDASVRSPLLPALLSLVPRITGDNLAVPLSLECLMGVLSVLLVYRLALGVWENEAAALLAAGAAALHPGLIVYSALLLTEAPFVVMLLIVLLLARSLLDAPRPEEALLMGIVAGLATLTRGVFFGPFCLLIVFLWSGLRTSGQSILRSTAFTAIPLLGCLAVLAPWTIRNSHVHHALVPISTFSGMSLVLGNNPYAHGTTKLGPDFQAWYLEQLLERGITDVSATPEYELMKADQDIALDYILAHPWDTAKHMVEKAYVFWVYPLSHQESNTALQLAMVAADMILYLGAALAIGIAWHVRKRLGLLWVLILGFTLVHLVLHAEARYRVPVVPLICIFFGGAALVWQKRHALLNDEHALRLSLTLAGSVVAVYILTAVLYLTGRV